MNKTYASTIKKLLISSLITAWATVVIAQQAATNIDILQNPDTLFANKPHTDLYWKALIQTAKNNKDEALKIAAAIKTNNLSDITSIEKEKNQYSIDDFFDHLFLTFVSNHPQKLSSLGLFESIGIRDHNAHLNDVSPQAILDDFKNKNACLNQLKKYDFNALSPEQKTSYKVFEWMLEAVAAQEKFLFHEYKVNQMDGILLELTFLLTQFHQLEIAEDVENYITRLGKIPVQIQQTIELLDYQKSKNIVPPSFALEKTIGSIKKILDPIVTHNIFYSHFASHIEKVDGINKESVLTKAKAIIQHEVYPAYQDLQQYCESLLKNHSHNHGVWALPNGDDYYAYVLQHHTTTALLADEIHELGLKEVAKIQHEMRTILATENLNDPNKEVGELMFGLSQKPQFFYPETDSGRAQCINQFHAILERSRHELSHLFDIKPKAPVTIQQVPQHEEEGQAAAYYVEPSIDGSRPGTFFINLRSMKELPHYGMETLAIHESEPGHHFQVALQQEMNMPILRKIGDFTAYVEGWALYAEKLAYEQGFYSSSFSKLGHLQDELLRAVRLVVDTGIHKKRWSREEAIRYMQQITGYNINNIITEVERYFVYPGQACAYKIGQLKILELRQHARNALGNKFDIREFHNVILKLGAAPLTILEEVIDQYIKEKVYSDIA